MQKLYAQALYTEAQKSGADAKALVGNLVKHLKETGREKLLPHILKELAHIEAKHAKLEPIVEVAHQKDASHALEEAKAHGIHAAHAHVNHDLVTGWRASAGGKLIDHSGKQTLIDLYQKITTP
jgi:F0F1-type ATP synthase delta subunit